MGQYRDFGNGRDVRNIYEKVIQNHADRLVNVRNPGTGDLMNILGDDVQNREDMEALLSNLKKWSKPEAGCFQELADS